MVRRVCVDSDVGVMWAELPAEDSDFRFCVGGGICGAVAKSEFSCWAFELSRA